MIVIHDMIPIMPKVPVRFETMLAFVRPGILFHATKTHGERLNFTVARRIYGAKGKEARTADQARPKNPLGKKWKR